MNLSTSRTCPDCAEGIPAGSRRLVCESCKKRRALIRVREWRARNPEKLKIQREKQLPKNRVRAKNWYENNKEQAQAASKKWRAENPEKMLAYYANWLAKPGNKDKAYGWTRDWRQRHPEKVRAYYKRWYIENQPILRELACDRARLYASSKFTFDDWLDILEVFNHQCAYCLCSDVKLTMDHIQPISRGGEHTTENIVPACQPCNSSKNARSIFTMLNVCLRSDQIQ